MVRAAYDDLADTYGDNFRSTGPEAPVDLALIRHFASLVPGERQVLDAGCGAGRMFTVLRDLGCAVEGVDLSPAMVRRARRDHPDVVSQVGTLTALPHADASFDGVFSWYSTIHSPDTDLPRIAEELGRLLRPGGVVLVAFQSGQGARDVSGSFRRHGHDVTLHRYLRTLDEVSRALGSTGLAEVARFERRAVRPERDSQAVVIAERPRQDAPPGPRR
ncbi:class I SAM-dependent methyltransferase [Intrasporangium sp. DVR]